MPYTIESANISALESAIQAAITEARNACSVNGTTSSDCAVAWDIVEELQAERSHKVERVKTNFDRYCDENPDALECRIYDV